MSMTQNEEETIWNTDARGRLLAAKIAAYVHGDQTRRGGEPYMMHIQDVVVRVEERYSADLDLENLINIAIMHDVLEDCKKEDYSKLLNLIKDNFPISVTSSVYDISKIYHTDYSTYIQVVKENKLAAKVKICDMLANLSDNPTDKQILKYSYALQQLLPS